MTQLKTIQNKIAQINTTKVSIIILVLLIGYLIGSNIQNNLKPVEVMSVIPPDNSITQTIKGNIIEFNFNKKLSKKEMEQINVEVNPNIEAEKIWKNNRTLQINNTNAKNALNPDQKYTFKILYNGNTIKETTMQTIHYERLSKEDQFQLFVEGQQAMQEEELRILEKRPWVANLPIKEKNYVVFWVDSEKKIFAQIYVITAKAKTPTKIAEIKKEITQKLKEIGVNTDTETITFEELQI